ncbi:hypothetical protein OAO18_03275 [Francisellaceae bacterium]|nr:hypothetical protein [Francisellaceae bacterium]
MPKNKILYYLSIICFLWIINLPILAIAETKNNIIKTEIKQVKVLEIKGAITKKVSKYIDANILELIENQNADLLVIKLDSYGPSIPYARVVAESILNSPVPVVVYVAPEGAKIANFGSLALYAANIAAMAPNTLIIPPIPEVAQKDETQFDYRVKLGMTIFMVQLAEKRERNSKLAADLIMDKIDSITAKKALDSNAINYVATNIYDLLQQMNNTVLDFQGKKLLLQTENAVIFQAAVEHSPFIDMLDDLATPTIAYLLFMIFVYCIALYVLKVGSAVPVIVGALALFLSLYGFLQLPITLMGFSLLVSGILFLVLDLISRIHLVFVLFGIVSFYFGSIWLYRDAVDISVERISFEVIILVSIATVMFFSVFVRMRVWAQQRIKLFDEIIHASGAGGEVIKCKNNKGLASFDGDIWKVASIKENLKIGDNVYPIKRLGLTIIVSIQHK